MKSLSSSSNPNLKPTMPGDSRDSSIKFLCNYGGRILPRYPDGKLRYHGGVTRVLSVDRSVSFSELVKKLEDMCGMRMSLRCQLPTEDLDALVSVTSDEDLANLLEEYDKIASSSKIRAFLHPRKQVKSSSPSMLPVYLSEPFSTGSTSSLLAPAVDGFLGRISPVGTSPRFGWLGGRISNCAYPVHGIRSSDYMIQRNRNL